MEKKRSSKKDIHSVFTWGGTNPTWETEAEVLSQKLKNQNKPKEESKDNTHYYLRDRD